MLLLFVWEFKDICRAIVSLTLMLTPVCNFGDVVATLQGIKLLIDQAKEMKTDMVVFGQNMNQSWRQVQYDS